MFKANEIERFSMLLDEPMKELEMRIMTDIVRRIRINGEITSAADWQINRLQQLGMSRKEVQKAIQTALSYSDEDMDILFSKVIKSGYVRDKSLYEATGTEYIPFEDNDELQQLISSVAKQTNETLHNITQSLGFAERGAGGRISFTPLADYYQKTLDGAMFDIASGAFDYNTMLRRVVKSMTDSGLRTVDYATGWSNRVNVAARRAIMTGMSQLTAKVNEDNAEQLDTDMFEVTWHGGARPEHQVWQGKWYTKEQLSTICGLGDVTGLCGANCYHDYYPVIPGISEPTYTEEELAELNRQENKPVEYNGKEYTKYEALQRQRRLETTMRAQREEMALLKEGGADEDDLINCRARYRGTSHEYARFSEAMGLPQQRERVSADGLGNIMQGKYTGGSGKPSPVSVPPVGAKVTDKVTAEERKELLSRNKVDIADNAKTTKPVEKASAVELWETENYKNSTEKGLLILPDGTTKDFGGIEHHVTGKEEDIKLMDGATFTHNHPTDNTFSQNDIVTGLVKGNLKEMRAVTSTGDVHILVNNGATEQQRKKFNADYQQRRMKAANTADAKIRRGEKINKDEYVKSRLETFMAEHAEEYNLSYTKHRINVSPKNIVVQGGFDESKIISDDIKAEISRCIEKIQGEYNVKVDIFSFEEIESVKVPFQFVPVDDNGKYKSKFVINKGFNWEENLDKLNERIYNKNYSKGILASQNTEDLIYHEMAHFMTFQECDDFYDYVSLERSVRRDFKAGISMYSDVTEDGAETIAEAFVRIKNNEAVSDNVKELVRIYVERWRK
ncbi:phage minor capsid protein [Ruminococcus flavefaciens]|uniref:phage minor capsid protein n=1 Tax=Ruminococcus flavefaciens TaxID=1265 RepID=UPI003F0A946B